MLFFFFFFFFIVQRILSAWQTIHMKFQELFSLKNKRKHISKYRLLNAAVVIGALRVYTGIINLLKF